MKRGSVVPKGTPTNDERLLTPKSSETIGSRDSKELVIALSGPVGSGVRAVATTFRNLLLRRSYKVEHIKLSDFLERLLKANVIDPTKIPASDNTNRYQRLQTAGNLLRKEYRG